MGYAALKAVHLLSLIAWVGGMFFVLVCLRPALGLLEPPARLRLMADVLRRFLDVVGVAIVLMVASGAWMLWLAVRIARAPGLGFAMPLDWSAMITIGLVMIALYGHIRFGLARRLQRGVDAQDWPAAAAALASIRTWVTVNLVLGAFVVVVMRLGAAG